MEPGPTTLTVLEWLLTYAIHSTVLIAVVWLVTTLAARKISHRTVDVLWKTALVGGVLTATLQYGLGLHPLAGSLALPGTEDKVLQPAVASAERDTGSVERIVVTHGAGHVAVWIHESQGAAAAPAPPPIAATPAPARWPMIVLALFALGAGVALVRLGFVARRLRQQLSDRSDVLEDPLLETFLQLCQRAGLKRRVRLTASPGLRSPVTLWPREVCIPERVVTDLPNGQQAGMLAHELAHVVRRDPSWLIVAAVVEAVFFFQPLNRLARRKMQEAAEYLADEWAVRHTGSRVHLAKCLAEVAGWLDEGTVTGVVAPMAGPLSPVRRRIGRILEERTVAGHGHPSGRISLTLALLAGVAWIAPGVSRASAGQEATSGSDAGGQLRAVTPRQHVTATLRPHSRGRFCREPWVWSWPLVVDVLDTNVRFRPPAIDVTEIRRRAREARRRIEEAGHRTEALRRRVFEAQRRGAMEAQLRALQRARQEHLDGLRGFGRQSCEAASRDGRDREPRAEIPRIIGV
jgi:beta-lactamase regulating signal transducer with metallopeptidase domain